MKRILSAVLTVGLSASGLAVAQPLQQAPQSSPQQHETPRPGNEQKPPRKGERLADGRGASVSDYRQHNLKKPPRGQEWRKVDDKYVLVKIATGIILQVVEGGH
ncbi:MAG: RcnB family protein [Pseudoxanthomonas sp.]